MKVPKLSVTHEHGSWAVVFIPMIVASGVVRSFHLSEFLFFVAATCCFLMYAPLQAVLRNTLDHRPTNEHDRDARFWVTLFGICILVAGSALVAMGFSLILPFALAAATFFVGNFFLVRYFRKSAASDLVAIVGLALGAPAMYYVGTGRIDGTAISLWLLNALFFGSSVFYVHTKMRASGLKRNELTLAEKLSIGKLNILYHFFVIVSVLFLTLFHFAPQLAIIAFVPTIIHAFFGTVNLTSNVRYKSLGLILLGQSLLFCILFIFIENS